MNSDQTSVLKCCRLAAAQQYISTKLNLLRMRNNAVGVALDVAMAHVWSNIASENYQDGANDHRNRISQMLVPEELSETVHLARNCLERACQDCSG